MQSIPRFTDITFGANPLTSGDEIVMCAILISSDGRTGKWDQILPNQRFTVSDEFEMTNGQITAKMRSYCKILPEPPTAAPSPAPTRSENDISFSFPPTSTNQFVHGLCVMGASYAEATSTNTNLSYSTVSNFKDGVTLWNDRNYVANGVSGDEMCEGGIYLKPSNHKVSTNSFLFHPSSCT